MTFASGNTGEASDIFVDCDIIFEDDCCLHIAHFLKMCLITEIVLIYSQLHYIYLVLIIDICVILPL